MNAYQTTRQPAAPQRQVTDADRAAFALARADVAERNAAEWDGRAGTMAPVYAQRFRDEAAGLRAHSASLRGEA